MSVFIYDKDALERMAAVEAAVGDLAPSVESWIEQQRVDAEGPCTFLIYLNEWEKTWRSRLSSWSLEDLKKGTVRNPKHGDISIYGVGGWHRYCVEGDGEIVFLSAFATPSATALAEETGFKVL